MYVKKYISIIGEKQMALTQPSNGFARPRDVVYLCRITYIFCIVIYSE